MSKVVLGKRPESFAPVVVKFTMPDGSEGAIECTFRYRTRREHGALIDEMTAVPAPADEALETNAAFYAQVVGHHGASLMKMLAAWGLDEPLTLENATTLADEIPAAVAAISLAYGRAVSEGRLGN